MHDKYGLCCCCCCRIIYICVTESELLNESEKLHLTALQLAHSAFGEKNVQTAKHYGNLGRLYQSMRKYKVNISHGLLGTIENN